VKALQTPLKIVHLNGEFQKESTLHVIANIYDIFQIHIKMKHYFITVKLYRVFNDKSILIIFADMAYNFGIDYVTF